MNRQQVAQVLTLASLVDNRSVTDESARMWHDVIGHVDYEVAVEAIRAHFAESTAWLLPAHITQYARAEKLKALPSTMSAARPECAPDAHRRLPDGTCLLCTHRERPDE